MAEAYAAASLRPTALTLEIPGVTQTRLWARSFDFGVLGPAEPTTTEPARAIPTYKEMTLLRNVDSSSGRLLELCKSGTKLPEVKVTVIMSGGVDGLTFRLYSTLITRVDWDGRTDEGQPLETVVFQCEQLSIVNLETG
jgi:type VI protein secretion system component Hcp